MFNEATFRETLLQSLGNVNDYVAHIMTRIVAVNPIYDGEGRQKDPPPTNGFSPTTSLKVTSNP